MHLKLKSNFEKMDTPNTDPQKLKLIKKYEIIDSLVGNGRHAKQIKNRFLKSLISRSIGENPMKINVVSSI